MKTKLSTTTVTLLCALCGSAISIAYSDDSVNADQLAIDIEQAMSIAVQKVPGTVTEAELEKEKQRFVWEIEIVTAEKQKFEVEVNAETGNVLEVEQDN